jgi:hypothetical protein
MTIGGTTGGCPRVLKHNDLRGLSMANWVTCTRKVDETPIYLNLETAMWLRWNEDEEVTIVMWSSKNGELVRVLEKPEEIFEKIGQIPQQAKLAADTAGSTKRRRQPSS